MIVSPYSHALVFSLSGDNQPPLMLDPTSKASDIGIEAPNTKYYMYLLQHKNYPKFCS